MAQFSYRSEGFTWREEVFHALTHGFGVALAVIGLVVLVVKAADKHDAWMVVSGAVYGTSLVLLFGASTLYHAAPESRFKEWLQTADHTAIYLLIAGTYTPFALVTLRGSWGWSIFGVVWGLAAAGMLFELILRRRKWRKLSLAFYLGLGWLMVIAIKPLINALPAPGLVLILIGGIAYTGGAVFYAWKKLPYNHVVWHVFVLIGSAAHFACIYRFVLV